MSTSEKRTILIKIQPDATYVVVTLALTHKGNFPIVLHRKSKFLSLSLSLLFAGYRLLML
jgi:hypothetical protein